MLSGKPNQLDDPTDKIPLATLTCEPAIYPRGRKNEKTVEAYTEALKLGAQFLPSGSPIHCSILEEI